MYYGEPPTAFPPPHYVPLAAAPVRSPMQQHIQSVAATRGPNTILRQIEPRADNDASGLISLLHDQDIAFVKSSDIYMVEQRDDGKALADQVQSFTAGTSLQLFYNTYDASGRLLLSDMPLKQHNNPIVEPHRCTCSPHESARCPVWYSCCSWSNGPPPVFSAVFNQGRLYAQYQSFSTENVQIKIRNTGQTRHPHPLACVYNPYGPMSSFKCHICCRTFPATVMAFHCQLDQYDECPSCYRCNSGATQYSRSTLSKVRYDHGTCGACVPFVCLPLPCLRGRHMTFQLEVRALDAKSMSLQGTRP